MSPAALDFVVRRCLAKEPDDRWQTARDLASQIEWIAQGGSQIVTTTEAHAPVRPRRERLAWVAVAILSVLWVATSIAFGLYLARPAEEREVRFDVATLEMPNVFQVTVSPDGRLVAFVARASGKPVSVLWIRPLDSTVAQPLAGTEGAINPFWSPDSRHIGFGADGKVKRIDVARMDAKTRTYDIWVPSSLATSSHV